MCVGRWGGWARARASPVLADLPCRHRRGGRGVVLANRYNFSNTFLAVDLEVSPTCLSITFNHNGLNTFVSPYFNCTTAVNATASDGNVLINPNYGGATVNYGPLSTGISVIGTGSR